MSLLYALQVPAATSARDEPDQFGVTAAVGLANEDNIFREDESADPTGDTYHTVTAGFHFDVPAGVHRLTGEASGSDRRFRRFEELDHKAWKVGGAWLWQIGSRFDGRVGYVAESMLASFANLLSGVQDTEPNQLRIQRLDAEGGVTVASRWRLRGAYDHIEHRNDSMKFRVSDMERDAAGLTLSYLSPLGNTIGGYASTAHARLLNLQAVGPLSVDNTHRQRRLGGFFEWVPTGKSRLQLRGGVVEREYKELRQRDYSTWTGSASYEWRPSERVSLTAVAQRDISEREQVNVGFVLARRLALQPAFRIGERTNVSLNLETSLRSYRGDAALGPLADPSSFRERLHLVGMEVDFRITPAFGLRVFGTYDARDASNIAPEYRAGLAGVELNASF